MSPQRKSSRRGTGWKPPRDRREVVIAVLASLAVIVVTASLVWFLRPNRDSGTSSVPDTVATSTTVPGETTTTAPGATTTVPATSAPASSTP
jgi:ABC-type phosphate transport system substrate-binding protein